jgi:hypothetical protein
MRNIISSSDRNETSIRLNNRSRGLKALTEFSLSLAVYGMVGWVYVAICGLVAPNTLHLPLTHLLPHLREDTSGVISFIISFISFVIYRIIRDNLCRLRPLASFRTKFYARAISRDDLDAQGFVKVSVTVRERQADAGDSAGGVPGVWLPPWRLLSVAGPGCAWLHATRGKRGADVLDARVRPVVMIRVLTLKPSPTGPRPRIHHGLPTASAATSRPERHPIRCPCGSRWMGA